MDCGFYFAAVGRISTARSRVICTVHFHNLPLFVLHYASAGYEVSITQAHLALGRKAEVLPGRIFAEIILLDIEDARKRNLARTSTRIFRIVDGVHLLLVIFWIVIDNDLQWTQDGHGAWRTFVQILSNEMFQHGEFEDAVTLGNPNGCAKISNGLGRESAPANSHQRRHSWVVPAAYVTLLYQPEQLAFAQQSVGEIQPVKFDLLRRENTQLLDEPVVERPMILKFECANGMRDLFQRV